MIPGLWFWFWFSLLPYLFVWAVEECVSGLWAGMCRWMDVRVDTLRSCVQRRACVWLLFFFISHQSSSSKSNHWPPQKPVHMLYATRIQKKTGYRTINQGKKSASKAFSSLENHPQERKRKRKRKVNIPLRNNTSLPTLRRLHDRLATKHRNTLEQTSPPNRIALCLHEPHTQDPLIARPLDDDVAV